MKFVFLVNGQWGLWRDVSHCSVSCGGGAKLSTRVCDNPPPSNGGDSCKGNEEESSKDCNTQPCPGRVINYILAFQN